MKYDYVIIGAGVCGSMLAYELSKHTNNILLIDKNSDVSMGASGAAGAFLSPLLGKPNKFKDLVNRALVYSTEFYKNLTPEFINNCGTVRVPKNDEDRTKFESYKPYIEFEYEEKNNGYYFPYASVVDGYKICEKITKNIDKKLSYTVQSIEYKDNSWIIDNTISTQHLILASGASIDLLDEKYIQIRPVWGQRIDIEMSSSVDVNYHKECSLAQTQKISANRYKTSIGATHHRNIAYKEIDSKDNKELLKKASNIQQLDDVKIIKEYAGARASSVDYFPMLGEIIDSKKTIEEFPYLKNGTHVQNERFTRYNNLYILNGVGGRGFVLAPYLAKTLVNHLYDNVNLSNDITIDRLFQRWVKKI